MYNLPSAVDLRSNYETVYNQGNDPACGPFAVANALDCLYERTTGKPTRFDPYYLWDWSRWHLGLPGVQTGSTFDSLERATRINGMKLNGEIITGFQLMRTRISDRSYSELKHLLAMGVPVIMEIKVTPDIDNLWHKPNWKTHQISTDTSVTRGQHYVSIVGYDEQAKRFLAENSWSSSWGDGGFFGIPYESMPSLTESLQHFNLAPIEPTKTEGYTVQAFLTTIEKSTFVDRSKQALIEHLTKAFDLGIQNLLDECIKWGVSDKHLEFLLGWERGSVRTFRSDNLGLNWNGFIFDQH